MHGRLHPKEKGATLRAAPFVTVVSGREYGRGVEPLAYLDYTGRMNERKIELFETDKKTTLRITVDPQSWPLKVRYTAGFYPTGTAVSIAVGQVESIFNPTDPAIAQMLDWLSRQRAIDVVINGQRETVAHGRMTRTQLQNILQRHARHLPTCRLDWAATLAEFTRPNLAAR